MMCKKHDNKMVENITLIRISVSFEVAGTFFVGWVGAYLVGPSSTTGDGEACLVTIAWPSFVGACTVACGPGQLGVAFVVVEASSN